jgi:L-lactate dehydrogenase complex protein LldG
MSARERILARVRAAGAGARPHPGPFSPGARDSSWEAFAAALAAVAGEAHGPVARREGGALVARLCDAWSGGGRVVASEAAAALLGDGPWRRIPLDDDPHALADVAVAILVGATAVAENGAIALDGREARPRAVHVLCERLVVLVDPEQVVPDMHAAIARMPGDALAHHHYTWVSGPSKTADIESVLVIGAHGPRALAAVGVCG